MMQRIPEIIEFKIKVSDDQRRIRAAEFSVCGSHIVMVDDRSALYAVAIDSGISRTLLNDAGRFVFSESTNELAVVSSAGGGTIHRFDMEQGGRPLTRLPCPFVSCLTYDRQGKSLIAGDSCGFLHAFRLDCDPYPARVCSKKFVCQTGLRALCANPSRIYAATDSGGMFSLRTSELEQASNKEWLLERSDWDSYTIACHDYMQMGAIAGYGSYVRFYRLNAPCAQILPTSFDFIQKLHYLSRAELLAVVGNDGLELWRIDCSYPFLVERLTEFRNIKAIREIGEQLLVACA